MKFIELEKPITVATSIAKLALQVGISVGVLTILIYCGTIGYYPTGVTFGDGLLFIAASLAFSLSYILVVIGLLSLGVTLTPVLNYVQFLILYVNNKYNYFKGGEIKQKVIDFPMLGWDKLGIVIMGLLILWIIVASMVNNFEIGMMLVISSLLMGFIYGLWNTKSKIEKVNVLAQKKLKIGYVIAIILIPIVISKSQHKILNQSMSLIGIRNQSAIVAVSEKYAKFLQANGVVSNIQNTSGEKLYWATILFNGIGTNTVIEIDGVELIIPSNEIIISTKRVQI